MDLPPLPECWPGSPLLPQPIPLSDEFGGLGTVVRRGRLAFAAALAAGGAGPLEGHDTRLHASPSARHPVGILSLFKDSCD